MASVGSLSSSTSNSIRGYGGLASGLDRDELIKGMTLGTTSKLNQQEQKKQKIEWMQEAVRAISDKMISFHGKYTETLTSPTNLFSSLLWGRNKITTSGDNSKYVSISGTASGADAMTIMGIKQKAQNASWSSDGMASDRVLSSGAVDAVSDKYAALDGKTLDFSYNGKNYSVLIGGSEEDLKDPEKAAKIINKCLVGYKTEDGGKNLSDLVEVTSNGTGFTISAKKDGNQDSKELKLTGGTALSHMGIEISDSEKGVVLSDDATPSISTTGAVNLTKDFAEMVAGQTLTFSYNGTSESVTIAKNANNLEDVKKSLQDSLDAKFGKGRILVETENDTTTGKGKLTFKTTIPGKNGADDTSSILKVTGGSDDALKALKLTRGTSNRTDLDVAISDDKLDQLEKQNVDGVEKYGFVVNGEFIGVTKGSTMRHLMNEINKSDAGVKVSYMEASDKFTFTSTSNGASGTINFGDKNGSYDQGNTNAVKALFGITVTDTDSGIEKRGQDAIVSVKYAGSDEVVNLRRDSNTFTVDGLTIALKGTFGEYDEATGELKDKTNIANAVEVNASADVDKLMDTIKSFVADYNAIVDLVNGELTTKHDRDYDPLTSDQKAELSETEISKWETKAKEGLLYGDSDLRSLSMDLRVVVSGGLLVEFEKIGINLSSSYSDNGKLSIDESKLRAALETDPEKVQNLFTSKEGGIGADGKPTSNGLATNLKSVMDKYVKTVGSMETKGILIRKAGSKSAAQSLTQNTYYDQLTALDKLINQLKTRLKTEQDRYISQFSTLETMIANMNSQSSYLSSMGGY